MKKLGFTLSEVLITLVIIGVIAAITIPTMVADQNKEALRVAFTKTYSDLNGFARKYYVDNGESFSDFVAKDRYNTDKHVKEFLKYYRALDSNATNNTWATPTEDRDSGYLLSLLRKRTNDSVWACDNTGMRGDISGKLFAFNEGGEQGENGPVICVDINGLKGPNAMGKDFFLFVFTVDGRAIPMGMPDDFNTTNTSTSSNYFMSGTDHCKKNTGDWKQNTACAYYALMDKSPENENKSYWKDFI